MKAMQDAARQAGRHGENKRQGGVRLVHMEEDGEVQEEVENDGNLVETEVEVEKFRWGKVARYGEGRKRQACSKAERERGSEDG